MTSPLKTPVDPVPDAVRIMELASVVASVVSSWVWVNVPVPDDMAKF